MTTYLLDTNIASHIIKGDIPRVRECLAAVPMHSVAVSVVTQAELQHGVAKRGHPTGLATKVREFLTLVTVLPWTPEAAEVYGELRAACEAASVTLSDGHDDRRAREGACDLRHSCGAPGGVGDSGRRFRKSAHPWRVDAR